MMGHSYVCYLKNTTGKSGFHLQYLLRYMITLDYLKNMFFGNKSLFPILRFMVFFSVFRRVSCHVVFVISHR